MEVATVLARRSTLRHRLSEVNTLRRAEAEALQTYNDALRQHPLTAQITFALGLHEAEEEKALKSPELNFDEANRMFEEDIEPLMAIRDHMLAPLAVEHTRIRGECRRAEMTFLDLAREVLPLPAEVRDALGNRHTLAVHPELRSIMVDKIAALV